MATPKPSLKPPPPQKAKQQEQNERESVQQANFVRHYLRTFNAVAAGHEAGYSAASCRGYVYKLVQMPHIRAMIEEGIRKMEHTDLVTRSQIFHQLWLEGVNPKNKGFERIAALSQLAKYMGMAKIEDTKPDVASNVMFIPAVSLQDWEAQAQQMQANLKERTAEGLGHAALPRAPEPVKPAPFHPSSS